MPAKTTTQDLFDRWISEVLAARVNAPKVETKVAAEARRSKIKTLLDCAAQLQCVADLVGKDPRDLGGFEEHFSRIAERAATPDAPRD